MRSQTIRQNAVIAILSAFLLVVLVKAVQSHTINTKLTHQKYELLTQHSVITTAQTEPANIVTQDEQAISQALQEWRQLYSFGNRKFTFKGYEHLYINTNELLAYDNVAPKDTRIDGWETYKSLWESVINESFAEQQITRFDIDRVEVSNDLGWSGITFRFRAKNKGKDFYSSQHGTHIWHKVDGRWRIVHEHMTAPVKIGGREVLP
ncbi:MAG: hypothetical protein N4J56_006763 [Chroococcidiopsis sp. SAG 2025]|nr:hypothetical protein [Chroococcidiopsis sp. SAG 2025]